MGELLVNYEYNGIQIDVSFPEGLSVLIGDSGLGKSLLLNSINDYWYDDSSVVLLNSSLAKFDSATLLGLCQESRVLLLDNADLYLTPNLLSTFIGKSKYIIVSIKSLSILRGFTYNKYKVIYENQRVGVDKIVWR